jgi:predicted regulator of Ras-like GTPase activity (Roadblock/LC7/MglB family)
MENLLRELVESNPELESVLVVDEEGIIVYRYDRDSSVDSEEVATHLVNPLNTISELFRDISDGEDDFEELLIFTRKFQVLVYKLISETYLVAVARRSPLYGRLRFKLRAKLPKLIKNL